GGASLVVYQPQVDAWKEFKILTGRCAFALKEAPGGNPVYGTFRFEAETLADRERNWCCCGTFVRSTSASPLQPERRAGRCPTGTEKFGLPKRWWSRSTASWPTFAWERFRARRPVCPPSRRRYSSARSPRCS